MTKGNVLIIYKSGAQVKVECDECIIKKSGGELRSITLTGATPRPMLYGINDIAAVWSLNG